MEGTAIYCSFAKKHEWYEIVYYLDEAYPTNIEWRMYYAFDDPYVRYNLFNDGNEWIVTQVVIHDPSINVFGVNNYNFEKNVEQFLKDTGLKKSDEYNYDFKNEHIRFNRTSSLEFTYVY